MKAHKNWSYRPYRPLFIEVGDIYICRVAPNKDTIHFEWLGVGDAEYEIFVRKRESNAPFGKVGTTSECEFTISGLDTETDYEFYVCTEKMKSRIRLARTGVAFGNVINYLHPDDDAYSFSGKYLCSPSIVRHPNGFLLASMDLFKGDYPQNLTLIFRSDDDGESWHYVSELFPCFWGKLFVHKGDVYMLACTTEYGDLIIGKSSDGGITFTEPTVLLRGGGGKNGEAGVHKNPQPVVEFEGRLWNTFEWGAWGRGYHAAAVMSAPTDSDLLDADSWSFSEPVKFDENWDIPGKGKTPGTIEGCLVEKGGKLLNIMRFEMREMTPNHGYALCYDVNTSDPEAPLEFSHAIPFPGNHSKFMIKYHAEQRKYYSIVSRITDSATPSMRNLLSLVSSTNLEKWELEKDIIDRRADDPQAVGFQYVDFFFEGNTILYQCRTSMNGAANFHDANYASFGRIDIE